MPLEIPHLEVKVDEVRKDGRDFIVVIGRDGITLGEFPVGDVGGINFTKALARAYVSGYCAGARHLGDLIMVLEAKRRRLLEDPTASLPGPDEGTPV